MGICNRKDGYHGGDASAEGVQRDLLPLIEGCSVSTRHGNVDTNHILFVGSGAFSSCSPSDMLAELQGRLPIRVELHGLSKDDLYRVLTEPESNLLEQQIALMRTEGVNLVFEETGVREIASVAFECNNTIENIGARRLHTILERIVEGVGFEAPDRRGETIVIDDAFVRGRVGPLLKKADLSKFVL